MNQTAGATTDNSLRKPHILLMEDEDCVAQGLQTVLKDEGYGVDLATTGQSALDSLGHKGFDLLVADLRLPDMNGMDVIKRVKADAPETEVIVITGYANVSSAVEAMKTGVSSYLPKPFTDDEFKAAVDGVLKGKAEFPLTSPEAPTTAEGEGLIGKGDVLRVLKGVSSTSQPKGEPQATAAPAGEQAATPLDEAWRFQQHKIISLGRLAASIVHEVNNPLSGILNYIRLMIRIVERRHDLTPETFAKFRRYLAFVESETDRCARILSHLLAFSRKSQMACSEVELPSVLERSLMLTKHKLYLQNIELKTEIGAGIPAILGDFNQIQQCVINLILNAIDAMPEGGVLMIGCGKGEKGDTVEIRVHDTGEGISEEDLPHIFEPFYTTKEEGSGLGLGLSTVRTIIERHKGRIHVTSEPGKGTLFTIQLPLGK